MVTMASESWGRAAAPFYVFEHQVISLIWWCMQRRERIGNEMIDDIDDLYSYHYLYLIWLLAISDAYIFLADFNLLAWHTKVIRVRMLMDDPSDGWPARAGMDLQKSRSACQESYQKTTHASLPACACLQSSASESGSLWCTSQSEPYSWETGHSKAELHGGLKVTEEIPSWSKLLEILFLFLTIHEEVPQRARALGCATTFCMSNILHP